MKEYEMGELGILNVGAGDNKLVFDPKDAAGMIRAARIVKDMIRRGYALLIEVEKDGDGRPVYRRATDFDETKCEYIIADFDPVPAAKFDEAENGEQGSEKTSAARAEASGAAAPGETALGSTSGHKKRGRKPAAATARKIPAASARGIAVGRSAGG